MFQYPDLGYLKAEFNLNTPAGRERAQPGRFGPLVKERRGVLSTGRRGPVEPPAQKGGGPCTKNPEKPRFLLVETFSARQVLTQT